MHRQGSGIIPARAGFTDLFRSGQAGDHGSSPLARGLRLVGGVRQVAVRIIPARAGFTRSCPPASRPATDHPRSRGVYRTSHPLIPSPGGSSPLARGLPTGESGLPASDGIIPARAGFTRPRSAGPAEAADHPRSRGVYLYSSTLRGDRFGSSPLARGLLPRVPGWFACRTDHPRSRGVYKCGGITIVRRGGSSPLARGLRQGLRVLLKAVRIIPARAGFTDLFAGRAEPLKDHPRSRGVYGSDHDLE